MGVYIYKGAFVVGLAWQWYLGFNRLEQETCAWKDGTDWIYQLAARQQMTCVLQYVLTVAVRDGETTLNQMSGI